MSFDPEMDKWLRCVSVVITPDNEVSVWINIFAARSYAKHVDGKLIEEVEVMDGLPTDVAAAIAASKEAPGVLGA